MFSYPQVIIDLLQGSVLGPTLLLYYRSDLKDVKSKGNWSPFADDTDNTNFAKDSKYGMKEQTRTYFTFGVLKQVKRGHSTCVN